MPLKTSTGTNRPSALLRAAVLPPVLVQRRHTKAATSAECLPRQPARLILENQSLRFRSAAPTRTHCHFQSRFTHAFRASQTRTAKQVCCSDGYALLPDFDGLSAKVQTVLEQQPFSGHVFVFRGRRGDIVKLLWWDGDGLCLFAKRLERGRFIWPQATEGTVCLSRAQLSMLLEGIDWRRPERTWTPQLAV
jgi:transposase